MGGQKKREKTGEDTEGIKGRFESILVAEDIIGHLKKKYFM